MLTVGFIGGIAGLCKTRSARAVRCCAQQRGGADPLLIVGCGRVGKLVGKRWIERRGDVVGETLTENGHDELRSLGILPRLVGQDPELKFPNVMCAIPALLATPVPEYVQEVKRALGLWSGEGGFVLTSSGNAYKENDGNVVTESGELHEVGHSEKSDRIILAEQPVFARGGIVLRLSGLYNRVAAWDHEKWFEFVERFGHDFFINLVEVDQAAELIMAIFERSAQLRGQALLGNTDTVLFQTLLNHVSIAQGQPDKVDDSIVKGRGLQFDSTWTRSVTNWTPTYDLLEDIADTSECRFATSDELARATSEY